MLVRYFVQACLKDPRDSPSAHSQLSTFDDIDELISKTSALGLETTTASSPSPPQISSTTGDGHKSDVIQVRSTSNSLVSGDRIIKVKTKNMRAAADFNWQEALAHVHLSSTSHVFLAIHERGNFISVERRAVASREKTAAEDLRRKEVQQGETMARLETFINTLRDTLISHSSTLEEGERPQYSLICCDREMALYRRTNDVRLPDEYVELFKA